MRYITVLFFLLTFTSFIHAKRPRPSDDTFYVQATVGQVWPKPQSTQTTAQQYTLNSAAFHFLVNSTSQTCDLLTSALDRYHRLIFFPQTYMKYVLNPGSADNHIKDIPQKNFKYLGDTPMLKRLNVRVQQPCEQYPTLESNESCKTTLPIEFLIYTI